MLTKKLSLRKSVTNLVTCQTPLFEVCGTAGKNFPKTLSVYFLLAVDKITNTRREMKRTYALKIKKFEFPLHA